MGPDRTADVIPIVRLRASEAASETAFALLDGLWGAPVGIAFFDRELRVLQLNDWMARVNGMAAADQLGRTLSELFPHVGVVARRIEERIASVFETGRPVIGLSIPIPGNDGPREWLASYYPVRAPSGEVRAVCAVVNDVTHEREREATIERARAEAERSARRLAFLQDVTAALSAAYDPEAVAEVVLAHVRPLLGGRTATIRLLGEEGALRVLATRGLPADLARAEDLDLAENLPMALAVSRDEAVWVSGTEAIAARFPGLAVKARAEGQRALVALPLTARGRRLGALGLVFEEPRAFDLEERAFVLAVGEQCAQALDRALLYQSERDALAQARLATERVAQLQAITAAFSGARSVAEVVQVVVTRAAAVFGSESALVCTVAPGGALRIEAVRGPGRDAVARLRTLPLDAPYPACQAARSGEAVWLESFGEAMERYPELAVYIPRDQLGALVSLPLRLAGETLGVASFSFPEAKRFDAPARELFLTVADLCAQAMERARLSDAEHAAREEAERARALLDSIVENAPVGIAFLDRGLRFQRLNRLLADLNGLPVEAHLGKTPREILPGLPLDELEAIWRGVLDTGAPVLDVDVSGETPAKPGRRRHFLESWYPVAVRGETIGVGALVRDVSAEREAEAFQRHVFGIVGHDLRNPLSAIVTATKLLSRGEDVSARQARLLARLQSSAERMDEIIRVLLDYAQLRAGHGVPIRPRRCDLAEICRAVADECEAANAGREVRCTGQGDVTGEFDPDRVAQVVSNLVTNGIAYSPRDSRVEIRWRGEPEAVTLEVTNAGPPIPADMLPRLFEPFQRGVDERRGAGLGLGLFIARAIVMAHGGTIEARPIPGDGTVFAVCLPRAKP